MSKNEAVLNVSVTFRHTESTPALKAYATEKITNCLQKYLSDQSDVHVILAVEKRDHVAEAVVRSKNYDLSGRAVTGDLYSAIDKMCDTLVAQLRKQKGRQLDSKHQNAEY